jgi:carbamoylphosphate synthase large subunit
MRRPRALVTGVGGPAGRSLGGQLLRRGWHVVGVDAEPVVVSGLHIRQVPAAGDTSFVDAVLGIARQEQVDLLMPTVSEELGVLAAHGRDTGSDAMQIVIAPSAGVRVANDKWLTCRCMAAGGIPVPRFALPSHLGPARDIARVLGVPYVSKPRVGRGGRGVAVHHDSASGVRAFDDSTILQEYIPGPEYAPNLYLASDPEDDVVVVLEKTALAQGNIGNARAVRRVADDDVARVARNAARAAGLTGPVDVDVRRRADGTPVILEINARFGANSHHAPEVLDALSAEHTGAVLSAA